MLMRERMNHDSTTMPPVHRVCGVRRLPTRCLRGGPRPVVIAALFVLVAGGTTGAAATPANSPILLVPPPPPAHPIDEAAKARAQAAYEEARRHYREHDYEAAARATRRTFEAVPNASTALAYAVALERAGLPRDAFSACLLALDLDPTDEEHTAIAARILNLGPTLDPPMGWLRVEVRPARATLRLEGREIPAGRTLGVQAGAWTLRVDADGYDPLERTVRVPPGAGVTVEIQLEETPSSVAPLPPPVRPAPAPPATTESVQPEQTGGTRVWPWVLIGSGAALVGGGVGMTLWARSALDDANRYAQPVAGMTVQQRKKAYDSANTDYKNRIIGSYVLYGVGAAAVVGGIVWAALPASSHDEQTTWSLSPWLAGDAVGLSFELFQ